MQVTMTLDWELLRDQKLALLECMETRGDHPLDGLLELIDFLQDCGEAAGENVKWLSEETDGKDRRMD